MMTKVWSKLKVCLVTLVSSLVVLNLILHVYTNTTNSRLNTEEIPPNNLDRIFDDLIAQSKLSMCNIISEKLKSDKSAEKTCSPLVDLTHGTWRPKNVTKEEIKKVKDYVSLALNTRQITQTLDRVDGRCGDVSLFKETFISRYIVHDPGDARFRPRALCNPDGHTPCCYKNHCVNRTIEQCQCDDCYDVRQKLHAELSQWVPHNPNCNIKYSSPSEACGIVTKAFNHVVVMGDSLMRHVFSSLLVLLRSGADAGSCLKPGVSEDIKAKCHGYYQLLDKECNSFNLWRNATVCDGNLRVTMLSLESVNELQTRKSELENLKLNSKSFVIMGVGIHDDFNAQKVIVDYINPTLELILQDSNTGFDHNKPNLIPHKKDTIPNSLQGKDPINNRETNSNQGYISEKDNPKKDHRKIQSMDTRISQEVLGQTEMKSVPNVLWLNSHLPGLLKPVYQVKQDAAHTIQFNRYVDNYLRRLCIPVMNTEELSKNLFSFDGTHYGLGMNLVKAKIILDYISKLN